ncbi:MAG TPA: RecQ family zinc-binding domain-containing protein, partial [Flavisolibacter sp.]|nr:RecQ family zinc-binding domain-containing protein [Flavisolibacter sp.]
VAAKDLSFNLFQYKKRKETFTNRVQQIKDYINCSTCRSQFISKYFGDALANACSICDNCLNQKSVQLTTAEFDKIALAIKEQLFESEATVDELLSRIREKKEKTWKVLQFLQSEKIIQARPNGKISAT